MNNRDFRAILLYEFKLGHNAAEATRNIVTAFGDLSPDERTAQRWFKKFRSGDLNLDDQERGRPSNVIDDDELKAQVEANTRITVRELAEDFGGTDRVCSQQDEGLRIFWYKGTNQIIPIEALVHCNTSLTISQKNEILLYFLMSLSQSLDDGVRNDHNDSHNLAYCRDKFGRRLSSIAFTGTCAITLFHYQTQFFKTKRATKVMNETAFGGMFYDGDPLALRREHERMIINESRFGADLEWGCFRLNDSGRPPLADNFCSAFTSSYIVKKGWGVDKVRLFRLHCCCKDANKCTKLQKSYREDMCPFYHKRFNSKMEVLEQRSVRLEDVKFSETCSAIITLTRNGTDDNTFHVKSIEVDAMEIKNLNKNLVDECELQQTILDERILHIYTEDEYVDKIKFYCAASNNRKGKNMFSITDLTNNFILVNPALGYGKLSLNFQRHISNCQYGLLFFAGGINYCRFYASIDSENRKFMIFIDGVNAHLDLGKDDPIFAVDYSEASQCVDAAGCYLADYLSNEYFTGCANITIQLLVCYGLAYYLEIDALSQYKAIEPHCYRGKWKLNESHIDFYTYSRSTAYYCYEMTILARENESDAMVYADFYEKEAPQHAAYALDYSDCHSDKYRCNVQSDLIFCCFPAVYGSITATLQPPNNGNFLRRKLKKYLLEPRQVATSIQGVQICAKISVERVVDVEFRTDMEALCYFRVHFNYGTTNGTHLQYFGQRRLWNVVSRDDFDAQILCKTRAWTPAEHIRGCACRYLARAALMFCCCAVELAVEYEDVLRRHPKEFMKFFPLIRNK